MVDDAPKKQNLGLLIEAAVREKKFFKVYQEFTPNPRAENITPKFYARHEAQAEDDKTPQEYIDLCARYSKSTPRDRGNYPETENQWYGWDSKPIVDSRSNKRLNAFRAIDPEIKLAAILKKLLRKEKPFEGVPFKI